jgi:deazaflavin-dependent oxidoreductase (nitroreductase family)
MGWAPFRARQVRVTTVGRRTGRRHTVPLWFVARGEAGPVYLWHCRGPTDWVANVRAGGRVTLDFGCGPVAAGATRIDGPERDWARDSFHRKYLGARLFQLLGWSRRATVFRVEAAPPAGGG